MSEVTTTYSDLSERETVCQDDAISGRKKGAAAWKRAWTSLPPRSEKQGVSTCWLLPAAFLVYPPHRAPDVQPCECRASPCGFLYYFHCICSLVAAEKAKNIKAKKSFWERKYFSDRFLLQLASADAMNRVRIPQIFWF